MNYKVKALCAAAVFALPGAAYADAMAVALSAAMQPTPVTTSFDFDASGNLIIPDLDVTGNTEVDLGILGVHPLPFEGTIEGATASYNGNFSGSYTVTENQLRSISVAAAVGRTAVASTAANNAGSTAANSGATDSRRATLSASSYSWGNGAYTSRVNID